MGLHIKASFNHGKHEVNVGLSLILFEEDDFNFVYSPALDITGYGKSEIEAKASFEVVLEEYLSYTHNKETIFEELEKLGWTVNKRKKRINAPSEDELWGDNETYRDVMTKSNVRREQTEIGLALA